MEMVMTPEMEMELENGFSPFPDILKLYNSQEVSQRVIIPSEYIKYYPKPLPPTAVLRKPEGNFWTVKWIVSQEESISFQDGWPKFVKENEIIEGDYILFTYDGSRSFWVRIYRNGLLLNPRAPINIEEISDDEDGDDMEKQEDNMIVSLSLGSEDEDDYDDYDGTMVSKKESYGKKNRLACVEDPETYLDKSNNPFFIAITSSTRRVLVIAQQAIKDYVLNFGSTVNIIDRFGEIERDVREWRDRVVVKKWDEIVERNNAKTGDAVVCEIFRERNDGIVHSIKVHFIRK